MEREGSYRRQAGEENGRKRAARSAKEKGTKPSTKMQPAERNGKTSWVFDRVRNFKASSLHQDLSSTASLLRITPRDSTGSGRVRQRRHKHRPSSHPSANARLRRLLSWFPWPNAGGARSANPLLHVQTAQRAQKYRLVNLWPNYKKNNRSKLAKLNLFNLLNRGKTSNRSKGRWTWPRWFPLQPGEGDRGRVW